MWVGNDELIELIGVAHEDGVYSSLIRCEVVEKMLILRFGIIPEDYSLLKRILEFRPFENTGVASSHYFLRYRTKSILKMKGLDIFK
ncbi:MAG: hypothetical protein LBG19_08700 [Prevotellaceae bacterium]|jgi:hypothetical protein|nr:hypothetical protein [Prevotellaceae bacterium]